MILSAQTGDGAPPLFPSFSSFSRYWVSDDLWFFGFALPVWALAWLFCCVKTKSFFQILVILMM